MLKNPRTIRDDTIGEFSVDWKAECDRLNLVHVTDKKTEKILKEETKTNTCECPV